MKLEMFNNRLNLPFWKIFIRNFNINRKKTYNWKNEGVSYPGFKYYPPPNIQDPPYEPSKLFMIKRIKPLKGCPYWEKNILKNLKLDGKMGEISIVKNIPEVNGLLWKIKHLIKIVPITYPNGEPTESTGTFLKENGELIVTKRLIPVQEKLEATENFEKDGGKMDGDTLRRRLRVKWLNAWDTTM